MAISSMRSYWMRQEISGPFINIFVNKKNVNQLQGLDTEIGDEDEVLIIPAVAGG